MLPLRLRPEKWFALILVSPVYFTCSKEGTKVAVERHKDVITMLSRSASLDFLQSQVPPGGCINLTMGEDTQIHFQIEVPVYFRRKVGGIGAQMRKKVCCWPPLNEWCFFAEFRWRRTSAFKIEIRGRNGSKIMEAERERPFSDASGRHSRVEQRAISGTFEIVHVGWKRVCFCSVGNDINESSLWVLCFSPIISRCVGVSATPHRMAPNHFLIGLKLVMVCPRWHGM